MEKPRRRRRSPEEARREALASARILLLSGGPNAVTLAAVAAEIGVTHANLIHHFGSAAGLQSALMGSMVADLSDALDAAAAAWTSGQVDAVMATYVHDEPLLVFLGDTPLKGPDSVRAALDARAAEPGGLGALSYEWFETLQFDVNTAVVSGRAVMTRGGKTHRGLFTRILRRTADGWLIVHDQLAWGPEA
ncbi:MAG TPA: TetR/AcrR family transcriptional regulator [Brevundimonas sp.]|nr:TetR/AcrR family transcriptional regulator [Brevundimonas sp.]